MDCCTPGFPVHHQLLELALTHVHQVGDAIQPSHLLSSPSRCLQSFPAAGSFPISQFFPSGGQSIGVSASASSFQWIFRTDFLWIGWLDLLAVQGTLKSLLQRDSSKASILRHSAFFIVQLSHLYMTTGKIIALTRCTFVSKVRSLLVSRLVIAFLPRSKYPLISWLQSPSPVILEPRKIKSAAVSQSICHEVILSLSSRGSLVLLHFLP